MKWIWVVIAVLSRFEGVVGVRDTFLTALTPHDAVECSQTNLTWFGGTPPYAISLLANDTNGYRALGFANIQTTTFLTKLPFAAGQWLEFLIRDAKGGEAVSSPFRVTSTRSSNSDCALIATPMNKKPITGNSTLAITSPTAMDSLSVCDSSFTVNWNGGQPPFNMLIQTTNTTVLMEQAFGGAMADGGSINTRVQIPAGLNFQVVVTDKVGASATTGQIKLANGGDSNCVITSDATTTTGNGAQFRVSGNANASDILLPTGSSQQTSTSAASTPSLAADVNPKHTSSPNKTVVIIASLLSVGVVGILLALFVFFRSHMKKRRRPTLDLLGKGSGASRDAERALPIPDAEMEKYRPEPYYLPSIPQRGAVAPARPLPPPSQSYYAAPVREYFVPQQPQQPFTIKNPDEVARSPVPPYMGPPGHHDEKHGFEDDIYSPTGTTYEVSALTWEDEKPMMR